MTPSDPASVLSQYRLKFVPDALAEWETLDGSIKQILRKLLKKHLEQPHLPGSRLHGDLHNCYKIKLKKQGYRLVYTVEDDVMVVLAVDKREDLAAYHAAIERILTGKLVS